MKKNRLSILLIMIFVCALVSTNALALPDNSVLSQHINEADGTSGQDTNSGSGVKTGHIQDNAVTTGKIAGGAVITSKVADGAVTTQKLTDSAVSTAKVADGAITTDKITDGAVTDTKITGPISGAKLGSHSHSGSDIVSGTIGVDKLGTYAGIKIVHKGLADGANTFNTINDALNAITDSSATNRYAVIIMPGVYEENVLKDNFYLKSYIDIIGQSRAGSIIKDNGSGWPTVRPGAYMMLKNLTIEGSIQFFSTNVNIYDCNIKGTIQLERDLSNITIENVSVEGYITMVGAPSDATTIILRKINMKGGQIDVSTNGESLRIIDTTIIITGEVGQGIILRNGQLDLQNINIQITYPSFSTALYILGGNVTCQLCALNSNNKAIYNASAGEVNIDNSVLNGAIDGAMRIGNSKIAGAFIGSGKKIVNCHDGNYDPIPNGVY